MKKATSLLLLIFMITVFNQANAQRIDIGAAAGKKNSSSAFNSSNTARKLFSNATVTIVKSNDRNSSANQPERSKIIQKTGSTSVDKDDKTKVCRTDYRSYTVSSMNQDIVDASAIENLRLGAVYSLDDLSKGDYTSLPNAKHANIPARAPVYISLSDMANSIKVDNPQDEPLRAALTTLRSKPYPVRPAAKSQYLESSLVNNETDFNLALGVSYTGMGVKASNYFSYATNNKSTKFLINYVAAFYTANASPINSGAFFLNNTSLINDPSLVYIDKITYGTRFMVCFEANVDETTVTDKFKGSGWGVTASMDLEYKKKFSSTVFKAYLFGSNEPLFVAKGIDELTDKVNQKLTNFMSPNIKNPLQLGSPISYSLRFLDGSIAASNCKVENMPSQYCFANPDLPMNLNIGINEIKNTNRDMWGWIDVEFLNKDGVSVGRPITIFNAPNKNTAVSSLNAQQCGNYNITINNISKEDRAGGTIRLWFWITSSRDNYCPVIGDNAKQVQYTTKPGHVGNHYYVDIPINQIMQNQTNSDGKPYLRPFTAQEDKGERSKFTPTFSFKFN